MVKNYNMFNPKVAVIITTEKRILKHTNIFTQIDWKIQTYGNI